MVTMVNGMKQSVHTEAKLINDSSINLPYSIVFVIQGENYYDQL